MLPILRPPGFVPGNITEEGTPCSYSLRPALRDVHQLRSGISTDTLGYPPHRRRCIMGICAAWSHSHPPSLGTSYRTSLPLRGSANRGTSSRAGSGAPEEIIRTAG